MPSDVLTALLGVLAGGAQGFSETTDKLVAERRAAEEADKERQIRRELLATEVGARAKEGEANRKLTKEQLLQERELTTLRLQAERDALQQNINLKTRELLDADAFKRISIQADIENSKAQLALKEKELGLQARGLDIEQAAYLGTGKLGTGTPTKGKGAGGSKEQVIQRLVSEVIKARIGAGGSVGLLPETAKGDIQYVTELLKDPVIGAAFEIPSPESNTEGGIDTISSHANPTGLGAAVTQVQDVSDPFTALESGLSGLAKFPEWLAGPENQRPLITRVPSTNKKNNKKKNQR